jgi:signal transduction histidine kinase
MAAWLHLLSAALRLPLSCAQQVMFSAGLMLGAFKSLDSRREGVMRQIQEAHRQTLLTELQRAIEQKDNFMSSVSHELRTPLNGIIGEGWRLAWACGAGGARRRWLQQQEHDQLCCGCCLRQYPCAAWTLCVAPLLPRPCSRACRRL